MGLFYRSYDKPGPGINKDAPRKKGVRRFFEVLGRDFGDLIKLNLFFLACVFPSAVMYLLGLFGALGGYAFILSIALAFPTGGALSACMYCVAKMLRDEPGWIWYDFKRKFSENVKQAAAPGIVCTAFIYMQVYIWIFFPVSGMGTGIALILLCGLALLLFGMAISYIFLQIAYVDLKTALIVKNSVLLLLVNAPRSFMGVLTGSVIWFFFIAFMPASLFFIPILLLFGFSLSWLLSLMWTWPVVNIKFKIEETLRKE